MDFQDFLHAQTGFDELVAGVTTQTTPAGAIIAHAGPVAPQG